MPKNPGEEQIDDAEKAGDESAQALTDARRVGQSRAKAGDRDLRDAETFRALREMEKK